MEETKLNNPMIPQHFDNLQDIQWQFQSNLEPYKETDPAKWTWQSF